MYNNMNGILVFIVWGKEMYMEFVFIDIWENCVSELFIKCFINLKYV